MKTLILLLLFFINMQGKTISAQKDSINKVTLPYLLNANFEIELNNGLSRTQFIPSNGDIQPIGPVAISHGLDFSSLLNLNNRSFISPSLGFGFYPFYYRAGKFTEGWTYYQQAIYMPYTKVKLNYGHRFPLKKHSISAKIGGGILALFDDEFKTGSTFPQDRLYIALYRTKIPVTFLNSDIQFGFQLKNMNILKFGLGYRFVLSPLFQGDYVLYQDNTYSFGKIVNNGNSFNFSVSLEITNKVLPGDLLTYSKLSIKERKEEKKRRKKENRYIHPNDIFITNSIGFATAINKSPKNQDYYKRRKGFASFIPNITIEKGIKNYYFGEITLTGFEYYSAIAPKNAFFSWGSNAFVAFQLLGGINKKIINPKNNRNIITFHTGMGIGVSDTKRRLVGGSYSFSADSSTMDTVWYFKAKDYMVNPVFPLLYIGISKDIRLAKGFYLSLSYRYNQGLITIFEQRISQYSSPPIFVPLSITMNGSYHTAQIGLKYRIKHSK